MTPKPRVPSPDEARLLTTYRDAERYLLETVRAEIVDVADVAQAGVDVDARRAVGIRNVRQAAEETVQGLNRGAPARIERVIGAAADRGVDDAVRELAQITGRGAASDYGDTINRGALDRLAAATVSTATDAHRSILRTVPDAYRRATERTVSGVLVGAQTRRQAAQRALWNLTDQGITSFTDRGGRRWRLSSYVEMATRTAAARAQTDAQLDRLAAGGHDLVQVSDAPRECPLCRPWEGRILSHAGGRVGTVQVPDALTDRTVSVTVAGTVDQARAAGLQHPNCRHSLSLYLAGVTPPMRAPARRADPGGYNAGQRQRDIERHIRAWKERAVAAVEPAGRRYAEQFVRGWQAQMRAHLAAHPDLKRLPYRESIGAGNLPARALRDQVGPDGPTPTVVRGKVRTPRQMTDAELDRRMQTALAGEDLDEFERLATETDRRDAARGATRVRRAAQREEREQRKLAEFDRLLAAGVDEEEAAADAFGVPIAKQRRDAARARLEGGGYRGSFEQMARAAFRDKLRQEVARVDDITELLSREARNRGIKEMSLWTRNEAFARRWAAEELRGWWDINGRLTYDAFVDGLLNGTGGVRGPRDGDFLQ